MKIFIIEKEENTGEGFWQNGGITLCLNFEIAKKELITMIKESNEGEFDIIEKGDGIIATSKNGWVRFIIYSSDVISQ